MKEEKSKGSVLKTLSMLTIMPVAALIAWPISIIGTSVGRTRKGLLQTPIRTYQHPATGRRIILVGVIHIGRIAYYREIQKLIDRVSLDKFRILYEGVGKLDDEDVKKLPQDQRVIVNQMRSLSAMIQSVAMNLSDRDMVYQKQGLEYPKSWINTDLTVGQIAKHFAAADIGFLNDSKKKVDENVFTDIPSEVAGFIQSFIIGALRILPGIDVITRPFNWFSRQKRIRNHIILTMRDEVAAGGILEHVEHADVLSIWGAKHIPGIHKHLSVAGFEHLETIWIDAL